MKKAVFLDRDGTLNIDHGYVHKIDDFQFIEGSIDALKELKEMGYLLVLVLVGRVLRSFSDQSIGHRTWIFFRRSVFTTYRMDGLVIS